MPEWAKFKWWSLIRCLWNYLWVSNGDNLCDQMLGEQKIASMVECKDFRKGTMQLEWEHKVSRAQIEDLNTKARDIQTLHLSKEQRDVSGIRILKHPLTAFVVPLNEILGFPQDGNKHQSLPIMLLSRKKIWPRTLCYTFTCQVMKTWRICLKWELKPLRVRWSIKCVCQTSVGEIKADILVLAAQDVLQGENCYHPRVQMVDLLLSDTHPVHPSTTPYLFCCLLKLITRQRHV